MSINLIETAKTLARFAHAGQTRRDGFTPYVAHPEAVAHSLRFSSSEIIAAAWLHDVLEDTSLDVATMRAAGIPDPVLEAIQLLTKGDEGYYVYLAKLRKNEIARRVKIADMLHNLSDAPTDAQIRKYAQGLLELIPVK